MVMFFKLQLVPVCVYHFHAICAALWTSSFNSLLNVLFHPMLLDWLVGQMVLLVVSI